MTRLLHPAAGMVALATIACFWLATALSELFGSRDTVIAVKTAIPWGLLLLVPALAATGGSGMALARRGHRPAGVLRETTARPAARTIPGTALTAAGLVARKRRRMMLIAANGLLVLVPAALFLAARAGAGELGTGFALVQAVELGAGAVNVVLLTRSLRDGLRLRAARAGAGGGRGGWG